MKIYVASSWRNPTQPAVIRHLEELGLEPYDFRNPHQAEGFSWSEVDPDAWRSRVTIPAKGTDFVDVNRYLRMVAHPRAVEGFRSDFDAMNDADAFVLVLPCGKSAHLELGWAVGRGLPTAILLEDPIEPELMYRMVDFLARDLGHLSGWLLARLEDRQNARRNLLRQTDPTRGLYGDLR